VIREVRQGVCEGQGSRLPQPRLRRCELRHLPPHEVTGFQVGVQHFWQKFGEKISDQPVLVTNELVQEVRRKQIGILFQDYLR
jgi:hypothetical protein